MSKIYKITYFDTQRERNQDEFIVFPRSGRPLFIDNLVENKSAIIGLLNEYIQSYKIPSYVIDRSIKDRRAQFIAALFAQSNVGPPVAGEKAKQVSGF